MTYTLFLLLLLVINSSESLSNTHLYLSFCQHSALLSNNTSPKVPPEKHTCTIFSFLPLKFLPTVTYLFVSLCLQGTFPVPMNREQNSIVCTENTALLREIFNQNYTMEHPISFPSKRCRMAHSRCEQCLDQSRCKRQGQ